MVSLVFQLSGFNGLTAEGFRDSSLYLDTFDPLFVQQPWGFNDKTWSAASSPDYSSTGLIRSDSLRTRRRSSACDVTAHGILGTCGMHKAPSKKKRVKCSICDETFSRRHDMMRHEASTKSLFIGSIYLLCNSPHSMEKFKIGPASCVEDFSPARLCLLFTSVLHWDNVAPFIFSEVEPKLSCTCNVPAQIVKTVVCLIL